MEPEHKTLMPYADLAKEFEGIAPAEMTPQSVLRSVVQLMEIVGKIRGLSGEEKKRMVTYVVQAHLEKNSADPAIMLVVPAAIDLVVDAAKGKFKFKQKLRKCCM